MSVELDYMEALTSDALAQAAYVSDAGYTADVTPVMTDYSSPSGTASAESELNSGHEAWMSFDSNTGNGWASDGGAAPTWLKYDFGSGVTKIITKIRFIDYHQATENFKLQGSNNDSDWDDVYTGLAIQDRTNYQDFTFSNSTAYRYYRIYISSFFVDYPQLYDLQLMETVLQSYSESTIKTQGTYSLKGLAAITDSLNDTLTKTGFPVAKATGGTITYDGGYVIHTFTEDGTFTPSLAFDVEYLVVAGGGGGGDDPEGGNIRGGGGGAGGMLTGTGKELTAQGYPITVGGGGSADNTGGISVFDSITATGGGAGANSNGGTGGAGGSGGGGGQQSGTGGTGTAGQGNDGGDGGFLAAGATGGGGGGASAVGQDATAGADGGAGSASSISGASVTYAGGGGGGGQVTSGSGGVGGGGDGGGSATAGTANTGGRGGGGGGTAGGSGIVIIKYLGTIDLSDQDVIKMDIRASRTGSNIKIGFHDSGGTTTEHTANIASANQFQTENIDISAVANADKDAIDSIIITITNADA